MKKKLCPDCQVNFIHQRSNRCRSCATKAKWQDNEWAEKVCRAREWMYTDPTVRAKVSLGLKKRWANPKWAKKTINAQNRGKSTSEHKRRMSKSIKAKWQTTEYRAKMETHLGSEAQRKKFSRQRKAAWERGCYDTDEWRHKQAEAQRKRTKERWANGDMDGIFKSPSSLEVMMAEALDTYKVRYIQQYRLEGDGRPFDFFIKPNVLIEVDGNYWHDLPRAIERDKAKTKLAAENGFTLIRIQEDDLRKHGAVKIVQERVLPLLTL